MPGSPQYSFFFEEKKQFFRGIEGNSETQEVFFVSGDDAVTFVGYGTGGHQAVFKILCLDLKCRQDIIVRHSEDLDNVEDAADDPVSVFHAAECFARDIENIRDGRSRNKPIHIMILAKLQDSFGVIKERIPVDQDVQKDIGVNHQFHIWTASLPAGNDGLSQQELCRQGHRRSRRWKERWD